jgi:hypothetical protein
MSKLEDAEIRSSDPYLKQLLIDIVAFWNGGHLDFQVVSTPPTDTPQGAEIRLFDSGAGSVRIYIYSPISSAWHYVVLT